MPEPIRELLDEQVETFAKMVKKSAYQLKQNVLTPSIFAEPLQPQPIKAIQKEALR